MGNKNKQRQAQANKVQAPVAPVIKHAQKSAPVVKADRANTNPMAIAWPTDKWGFTRDLRKAITVTASRLAGDADKMQVLQKTLELGAAFIAAKYQEDAARRAAILSKAQNAHVPTPPVAPEATVEDELFDDVEDVDADDEQAEEHEDAAEAEESNEPEALEGEDLEDALFGDEELIEDEDK